MSRLGCYRFECGGRSDQGFDCGGRSDWGEQDDAFRLAILGCLYTFYTLCIACICMICELLLRPFSIYGCARCYPRYYIRIVISYRLRPCTAIGRKREQKYLSVSRWWISYWWYLTWTRNNTAVLCSFCPFLCCFFYKLSQVRLPVLTLLQSHVTCLICTDNALFAQILL